MRLSVFLALHQLNSPPEGQLFTKLKIQIRLPERGLDVGNGLAAPAVANHADRDEGFVPIDERFCVRFGAEIALEGQKEGFRLREIGGLKSGFSPRDQLAGCQGSGLRQVLLGVKAEHVEEDRDRGEEA